MSLSVTELCHHDIPVTLLFAVNNADRWLPGAKGVAIPDNPETDIILSPRDSELGWGNAGDTLPFEHSMQLEYEACIAETVVTALDAAAKLFSKRFLMHANAISNFRAALKEQSVQHVPPRSIECQQKVMLLPLDGDGAGGGIAEGQEEGEGEEDNVVGVRLRFDHTAMWRMRTVFFEVTGVPAEEWSVSVE